MNIAGGDAMGWLADNIVTTLNDLVSNLITEIFLYIQDFFTSAEDFITLPAITEIVNEINGIAILFLIFVAVKQIITTYILETDGDSDVDPLMMIEKTTIVMAVISCHSWVLSTFLKYAGDLSDVVMKAAHTTNDGSDLEKISTEFVKIVGANMLGVLISSATVIMIILFLIKAALRTGELCLIKIIFPFFACDLLTTSHERWNAFLTNELVTVFGYVIQLFCFRFGVSQLAEQAAFQMKSFLIGITMLWLAIKIPKWLEKFVYSSGLGRTVGGGARTAAYMAPQVLRIIGK